MNYLLYTLIAGLINVMSLTGLNCQTESRAKAARPQTLQASSLIWRNRCAVRKEEQYKQAATMYCLHSPRARGYQVSEDLKSVVVKWLAEHPHAMVVPIYSSPMFLNDRSSPVQVYAWVVDRESNLNLYLVRMGACPSEMMKLESGDKPMISNREYEAFVKRITEAERDARTERLGIWRNQAP